MAHKLGRYIRAVMCRAFRAYHFSTECHQTRTEPTAGLATRFREGSPHTPRVASAPFLASNFTPTHNVFAYLPISGRWPTRVHPAARAVPRGKPRPVRRGIVGVVHDVNALAGLGGGT